MPLEDVALVAETQQNLSNLYSVDIYAQTQAINVCNIMASSGSTVVEQPSLDPLFAGSNIVKIALKGWHCLFSTEVHKTYTIKLLTIDFVHAYNINGSHCSLVVKREKINEKNKQILGLLPNPGKKWL